MQPHHDNRGLHAWGDRRWVGQWWTFHGL